MTRLVTLLLRTVVAYAQDDHQEEDETGANSDKL